MTRKHGLKIVAIGGGSSYTPELVEGFIKRYDHLPVRELWLVDIPEGKEKLNIVGNLAKHMVNKAGLPIPHSSHVRPAASASRCGFRHHPVPGRRPSRPGIG